MADTREIVIKLIVDSDSEGESQAKKEKKDGGINLSQLLHPLKTAEKALKERFPVAGIAFGYAVNATKSSVLYALNRNFSLKEDYQMEVTFNNTMNLISKFSSGVSAIGAGALIGGVPGAIMAAVGWGINQVVSGYQKYDQQQISLNTMNYTSTFQRVRAGLVDGGRGTEN